MLVSQLHPQLYNLSVLLHRLLRTFKHYINFTKFAHRRLLEPLPFTVKKHKSLLLRKLGEADMQLQINKITNLKLAVEKMNNILIMPGETFSFWKLVGLTTYKKGYKDGIVLVFDKFQSGLGGGLCQLANLIYWMALHSPLEITERHHHGYDVFPDLGRVIPFGTGATIFYNYVDLQIYNPTNIIFQLSFSFTEKEIKGQLLSSEIFPYTYKIFEKDHQYLHDSNENKYYRSNKIFRRVIDKVSGNTLQTELLYENYLKMSYIPEQENLILINNT